MKKSTFGILAVVFALSPLTAVAQDAQTNVQSNTNSGAAVGTGNVILQNTDQTSVQKDLDLNGDGIPDAPDAQTSVQVNQNEAAAVGTGNYINQNASQTSVQDNVDINQYLPKKP